MHRRTIAGIGLAALAGLGGLAHSAPGGTAPQQPGSCVKLDQPKAASGLKIRLSGVNICSGDIFVSFCGQKEGKAEFEKTSERLKPGQRWMFTYNASPARPMNANMANCPAPAGASEASCPATCPAIQQDRVSPVWARRPTPKQLADTFPERAMRAGVSGVAELECSLQPDGNLGPCRVSAEIPASYGFGEAAMRLIPHFQAALPLGDRTKVYLPVSFTAGPAFVIP